MVENNKSRPINWNEVIRHEARGRGDIYLGKVQGLSEPDIVIERGTLNKEKLYIPKSLADRFDGDVLYFRVTEEEANKFLEGSSEKKNAEVAQLNEERIVISKTETVGDELTIIKEPFTETKTVQVELAHQEATVQKRPVYRSITTSSSSEKWSVVQSKTEIKIPLKKEEIHISKEPYIKEEIIIKKKPVVETRTVSEEVKSEKIRVKENMKGEEREYS
jgi:uncharacterized protein (TIGR02271 family)